MKEVVLPEELGRASSPMDAFLGLTTQTVVYVLVKACDSLDQLEYVLPFHDRLYNSEQTIV
jgi:hypothetical protein